MISYFFFFLEYLLIVDPDQRPDIFQASYVAFRISGRDCPVQNLNVSTIQCLSFMQKKGQPLGQDTSTEAEIIIFLLNHLLLT